ncbi:MAG: glycosyltransferase family 2 protein [bacterium]
MNSPVVSICIPTFNRPELLKEAVQSCLNQTFSDFEIVITDNSTNDDSLKMISGIGDSRIRYYRNEGNIGSQASSVRALSLSSGKYVKWLMDDDLMSPVFLELTVEVLERHPSAGVAMAPMDLIDANGHRIIPRFYVFRAMDYRYRYRVGDGLVDRKTILHDFLVRDYPCCVPSGVLFRHEILQRIRGVDPVADFAADLDICMRAALHSDFYYIDQVLSSWRYFPQNYTANMHLTGMPVQVFYYITRKILKDPISREMFAGQDWAKLERDSLFFCSCRALLNFQAAWNQRSPRLVSKTLALIWREDPYRINLLRLPLFVIREIWASLFGPKLPPPRS